MRLQFDKRLHDKEVKKALNLYGGPTKLASKLNISRRAVQEWQRGGRISPVNAYMLDHRSDGLISMYNLRSDVYREDEL